MKEKTMKEAVYHMITTNTGFNEKDVETEAQINKRDTVKKTYKPQADIVVENLNQLDYKGIAIECKVVNKTELAKGIGQALNYKVSGYYPYICVPDEFVTLNLISLCHEADVGLLFVSSKVMEEGPSSGGLTVAIDKHNVMKGSSYGFVRDDKVGIRDILDTFNIESYSDLRDLKEDLERLQLMMLPYGDYRSKTERLKGCLPEDKHTVVRTKI